MTSQQPDEPGEPTPPDEPARLAAEASSGGTVFQAGRDQHLHFADGAGAATRVRGETAVDVCPYPGLAAFGPDQERWFFGRDRATATLCQRLDAKLAGTGPLILIGPSGAGKSSLLRAGLIPALAQGRLAATGSASWPHPVLTPTAHPTRALAQALSPLTGGEPVDLAGSWLDRPEECVASVRATLAAAARAVILVDQFEEVFTLCADERERRAFIDLLDRLAARPADGAEPAALVLISVRADSYAECLRYPSLRAALKAGPVLLDPMTVAELRQAILFPAQDVGLDVEPGLIEVLLRDASVSADDAGDGAGYPAGRLPLLAHALRSTWQQREGHRLTVHGYQVTGGISNAVATSADQQFESLDETGQQAARALFLRLVKMGDGTEDVCRRVSRAGLIRDIPGEPAGAVLDAFTRARLLTQDQDTVSITHEVLLRAWPRLRTWLDADRAGHLIRQDLEAAAGTWDRDQRPAEALYRGSRLDVARAWAAGHGPDLTPAARDFLVVSARQQRRTRLLRRWVVATLAVLTVLAVSTSIVALQQRATAIQQRDLAIYNQVVTEALQLTSSAPALAAELDIAAYRMRPGQDSLAHLVSEENTPLPSTLASGGSPVLAVAFSPGGRVLASGNADGLVQLWAASGARRGEALGRPVAIYPGGGGDAITSVAFSPGGGTLAAADYTGVIQLWQVQGAAPPRPLIRLSTGDFGAVDVVAFSPDGRVLAAGDEAGRIRLWDVADPAHPRPLGRPLIAGSVGVESVAFSGDGTALASGAVDGTIRLWDVADPARPRLFSQPLRRGTGEVESVALSRDGRTLASGSLSGAVRLWDVANPARPRELGQPLTASTSFVRSLAFSPDGAVLATGGGDGAVRLWDVADPASPQLLGQPLTASTGGVQSVAFGPDGRTVAAGGNGGAVELWRLPGTMLTSPQGALGSAMFSPDGHTVASIDGLQRLQFWAVADAAQPRPAGQFRLPSRSTQVDALAFGPDSRTLATGDAGGGIQLWDTADPARLRPQGSLTGPSDLAPRVNALAFRPDGRVLASGYEDGTVRLWGVAGSGTRALGPALTLRYGTPDSLAFSPDGRVLAVGTAGIASVELWDVADPARPRLLGQPLIVPGEAIHSVAFSPDGRMLAAGGTNGAVGLWRVADPAHPYRLGEPGTAPGDISSLAFSPDGRTLASGSSDGTLLLWDVAAPAYLQGPSQAIDASSGAVKSVAFSPDGRTLVTGGTDGAVRLWILNAGYAIRYICGVLGQRHQLTRYQWDRYVSAQLPYRPAC